MKDNKRGYMTKPNEVNLLEIALENNLIRSECRTGNSTRLIDLAIQLLYKGKEVLVKDDYKDGTGDEMNRYLLNKIVKKLEIEHHPVAGSLTINKSKNSLCLK